MLTYQGHVDKEVYEEWFREMTGDKYEILFLRIAHEVGETGYLHSHVLVKWNKPFQTRDPRRFDYADVHPNINPVKTEKHWKLCVEYLGKQDPENEDLLEEPNLVKGIMECNTSVEALEKYCQRPSDATGILAIRKERPMRKLRRWTYKPYRQWELDMIEMVKVEPDERHIYWYWDPIGNTGKSKFAKWMYLEDPDKWVCVTDMGTSRDSATLIQGALNRGWEAWGVMIDLPRMVEENTRIYKYIEEIKNGFMTVQKWEGTPLPFETPHVIVFANWQPRIDKLSRDRWVVRLINQDGTWSKSEPLTLQEETARWGRVGQM